MSSRYPRKKATSCLERGEPVSASDVTDDIAQLYRTQGRAADAVPLHQSMLATKRAPAGVVQAVCGFARSATLATGRVARPRAEVRADAPHDAEVTLLELARRGESGALAAEVEGFLIPTRADPLRVQRTAARMIEIAKATGSPRLEARARRLLGTLAETRGDATLAMSRFSSFISFLSNLTCASVTISSSMSPSSIPALGTQPRTRRHDDRRPARIFVVGLPE